jgi:hypothetical protein
VRLLIAGEEPRDLTLADAVNRVMGFEDPRDRMKAKILRNREPALDASDVEAIDSWPDFSKGAA